MVNIHNILCLSEAVHLILGGYPALVAVDKCDFLYYCGMIAPIAYNRLLPLLCLLVLYLPGCTCADKTAGGNVKQANRVATSQVSSATPIVQEPFADLRIQEGALGGMKIGMTIGQAEEVVSCCYTLIRKKEEAVVFGLGGGSPAYVYYTGDTLLFGLIPKLDTDTLMFIIAAYKGLLSGEGLHPGSTVGDLMAVYPELSVQQDLMNEWEVIQDEAKGWDFVFMTDEKTAIGSYPDPEAMSKPVNTSVKADWILIR